jgi:hypothetical protein
MKAPLAVRFPQLFTYAVSFWPYVQRVREFGQHGGSA